MPGIGICTVPTYPSRQTRAGAFAQSVSRRLVSGSTLGCELPATPAGIEDDTDGSRDTSRMSTKARARDNREPDYPRAPWCGRKPLRGVSLYHGCWLDAVDRNQGHDSGTGGNPPSSPPFSPPPGYPIDPPSLPTKVSLALRSPGNRDPNPSSNRPVFPSASDSPPATLLESARHQQTHPRVRHTPNRPARLVEIRCLWLVIPPAKNHRLRASKRKDDRARREHLHGGKTRPHFTLPPPPDPSYDYHPLDHRGASGARHQNQRFRDKQSMGTPDVRC